MMGNKKDYLVAHRMKWYFQCIPLLSEWLSNHFNNCDTKRNIRNLYKACEDKNELKIRKIISSYNPRFGRKVNISITVKFKVDIEE